MAEGVARVNHPTGNTFWSNDEFLFDEYGDFERDYKPMQLKRLKSVSSKMDLFPYMNFLLFVVLFGLSSINVFPISTILTVEGSLLELRRNGRTADKLESADDHKINLLQLRSENTSENLSSSEHIRLTTLSHNRRVNHENGEILNYASQSVRNTGEMGVNTMDDSVPKFNFSGEKDSQFPTATYSEKSNNDSEEISLSTRNETDHFGWAEFGWADVGLVTLFCSIIAGTVAGNMLVIAAVVTTRRLRTVTNCFVMSLAVADWLVGMFVMPPKVFLYFVDNEWRFGRIFCELWISLDILLCTASILSLCAISIDRYLAITRPLAYSRRRRSKRLALSMISCVWIAAVVITSPPIFGWYEENRNTENKCDYNENTGYVVYSALGSFFLPLLVMLYVYARIACVIMRRQRSIQKLHARGDRKSQYCGSDAEEPLHQKDRVDEGRNGEDTEKPAHQIGDGAGVGAAENQDLTPNLPTAHIPHHHLLGERQSVDSQTRPGNQGSSLLGRFRLSSCTAVEKDEDEENINCNRKKSTELTNRQNKHGERGSGSGGNADTAEALAISLPDPATLASGSGTENSSGSNTDPESACGCSSHSKSNALSLQQEQHRPTSSRYSNQLNRQQHHQFVSRMKTGSRLCHHSIATASPQKNIHRIHQASSSSGREFGGDHEIHLKSTESCRSLDKSPRVWTVEATNSSPVTGKRKGKESKTSSTKCRSCSYEHELTESCTMVADKSTNQIESVMMLECSPAGNPASLMSAASAPGNTTNPLSPPPHDKQNPYSNRIQSRIYQPHNTQSVHHRIIPNSQFTATGSVSMQRGRSMKFVPVIQTNDQNHNGGTSSRDFSSGRIASFKRETKTAQTLAAVVGGFIICWLPFFVAYIMGPFTPSSDTIPSGLMDALIWLGWSNSAINPFIYAFYSDQFRSAFWRLTVHKCEAVLRNRNQSRSSPRRYEDPPQQHRTSA